MRERRCWRDKVKKRVEVSKISKYLLALMTYVASPWELLLLCL
jgi:hypothetical protein